MEGNTLYYTTNRSEVVALDTRGDGKHAKVIWKFDMMEELGNYPHNLSNSSPLIWENLLILSTGNGQDETHYLEILEDRLDRGTTPAQELLDKFNGPWAGSVDPIYAEQAY